MTRDNSLLPDRPTIQNVLAGTRVDPSAKVLSTRDHGVIREWAARRHAQPATGEKTSTGPATVDVKDGGAGVRFNFPGQGQFRPITWNEWFENFDRHECAFVYDNEAPGESPSSRYRIVKAAEWQELMG